MGAYSPRSTDAIMLDMSEMRSVAAYAARVAGDPAILAIWLPVKRSYARLPVIAARESGPPTAFSAGRNHVTMDEKGRGGVVAMITRVGRGCT